MDPFSSLLLYCRAGFEADVAQEAVDFLAARRDGSASPDYFTAQFATGQAFALVHATEPIPAAWSSELPSLTFARQALLAQPETVKLGAKDRVGPLVAQAREQVNAMPGKAYSEVWIDYPDTNEGKTLSSLARGLHPHLRAALAEAGLLRSGPRAWRLHVFLTSKAEARLAAMPPKPGDWPMGIARLRMPATAPSRSTLKLSEALLCFLGEQHESFMQPEMRAVDLGAAPGGWTWLMIHRGVHVTAVDNGALKGELVGNALVRHLREDGFRFRPKRPVEWLTCDMVEQPSRIAALIADWIATGHAQHAIFNLKLPMKKRLAELTRCQRLIDERLTQAGVRYILRIKHLYHDREEVTAFLTRQPKRLAPL